MKLLLCTLAAFALFVGVSARLGTDTDENGRKLEADIADVFAEMMDDAADASEKVRDLEGKYGGEMKEYDWGSSMMSGGKQFDMAKIMEAFSKDVNYTDLYDRCCSSLDADMPSSYDMTKGADVPKEDKPCKCPIRESDKFVAKWDEKCESSVKPKADAQAAGEEVPTMAEQFMEKFGEGGAGGFNMEKFFSGKDKNYTDIYMRCCGEDLSDCNCPVRQNETYAEKWEDSCETKLAYKAGIKEYDGSGAGGYGGSSFGGMGSMMEKFFGKSKNYTDIYDRCCTTQDGLFATSYDEDVASCKCPVRQNETFSEKWSTSCEEKIAPKVMEEMSG
eukprot:CAMPEP_0178515350 /NCGR_PEP_ID=MMETSP0696-20121128/24511_1 /TAXON_ID=265572 /ORGANISM="Extubocellulus spinifer, Strain CCMP396" /LENGTH=331 /DNA_ID=CAMNT_0020145509 /DNA_START=91 /DNA_END=1086 /DNA_ORIENTATION=+